ncbi:MAG TPA: hypothetical protein VGB95_04175, partial [Chitinophagales bacterium]
EKRNMTIGVCMIDAAMPYKKQLLKDYDIDIEQIDLYAKKLGELIGLRMASVCPEKLLTIATKSKSNNQSEQETEGNIVKIDDDLFVVLSLKEESNKITKYYWLTSLSSDLDLMNNYKSLIGAHVLITYESKEFFDPKLKEYRQFSVIKEISKINK